MTKPGRLCPLHYRYSPSVFAPAAQLHADTVLIAGGLYGNLAALDGLKRLLEPDTRLVFNGDFNWFNTSADGFQTINEEALAHTALRGNVETELRHDDTDAQGSDADYDAGCGCAYPPDVEDALVERSNDIMLRLREIARGFPQLTSELKALPMHLVAQVGDVRIAIVHGDAHSLSGWDFGHDSLHASENAAALTRLFSQAQVDVFASSHTCLPALRKLRAPEGEYAIINNGAAGMPNFAGTHYGIATRISIYPCPPTVRLYGTRIGDVFVDAVKLHYDHIHFVDQFLSDWACGSPGYASYFSRIIDGPAFSPEMALGVLPGQHIRRRAG